MSISEAIVFLEGLKFSKMNEMIAKPIIKELKARLNFLASVGLDYLSLSRSAGTLSGGEAQRIKLYDYISKQIDRGSNNVVQYQVEYHKRIAASFASFILTIIGLSLSSRKRKGGMGLYLGIGLALSFTYIMLQTISSTFAINADFPPMLAAWTPNIIFAFVAYFCYRHAPN